jgi:hypothetical protein
MVWLAIVAPFGLISLIRIIKLLAVCDTVDAVGTLLPG